MNSGAWIAGLCPDERLCPFFLFGVITIKMIDDKRTYREGLKDEMREILSGLSQLIIINVLEVSAFPDAYPLGEELAIAIAPRTSRNGVSR
jgi:hypothetical protein